MSSSLADIGIHSRDAGTVLAAVLAATTRPLTRVLSDLAGCDLRIRILASGTRPLTDAEAYRLDAAPIRTCRWRHALLLTPAGLTAASTSLLWLPPRLPWDACTQLDKGQEPAGVILSRHGMTRTDRRAMATRGIEEVTGADAATRSSAVLVVAGAKAAIAEEHITRVFAESLA